MADVNSLYTCTPRQTRGFIKDILLAGLVPFVRASPGTGKSSIFKSVADEFNLWMIDHRLSTSEPTDLSGLPKQDGDFAYFTPFAELFPVESTPIPAGKDGWLVFLDEFNSANKQVQAASYKLILDRMTGQYPLHERVVIGMAGNLDTDRAIVNMISTAMQSRVVHLKMIVDGDTLPDFMEDVALKDGWDPRIIAYLNQYPSILMDFNPNHTENTFCCPRTWEFVNRLIKGKEVTDSMTVLLAGTITATVAAEFVQFCQIYTNLITVSRILADPKKCVLPYDINLKWATICGMMEKVTNDNFEDLSTYANRFDLSFRVLFFRATMVKHPTLRHHPAYANAMVELSRYLNG